MELPPLVPRARSSVGSSNDRCKHISHFSCTDEILVPLALANEKKYQFEKSDKVACSYHRRRSRHSRYSRVWLAFRAVPSLLLVGAILRGHWQRTGTWMMWFGAALLSLWTLPFGARILLSPPPIDRSGMSVFAATAVTLLLVVVCDMALAVEALRVNLNHRLTGCASIGCGVMPPNFDFRPR
jgi:hypothetical protein